MRAAFRSSGVVATLVALGWCAASVPAVAQQCDRHCGTVRWAVKTLTDGEAGLIDTIPQAATIAELRALHVGPRRLGRRIPPVELTTYAVDALLLGWKKEPDHDFHLVVADPRDPAQTMLVEVPGPTCPVLCRLAVAGRFAAVRQQLIDRLGEPSSHYQALSRPLPIQVTGVGFFDYYHGQTGEARNGIELHPVMTIRFPD